MATLVAVNPRVIQRVVPQNKVQVLIKNGSSWKAGQWLDVDTSGLLTACASDADAGTGGIKYQALTDQDDPGDSTTYAKVEEIDAGTVFRINELNGTVTTAAIGNQYGIDVTSNVLTLDVGDTTNYAVKVVDVGSNRSPVEFSDADVKGVAFVKVLPVCIDAVAQA